MERRVIVVILAGLALLMPSADATSAQGELLAQGPIGFPSGTLLDGSPLAVFTNGTDLLTRFTVSAPTIHLIEMSQTYSVATEGPQSLRVAQPLARTDRTLHDARLEMVRHADLGWIGVYPTEGRTHAALSASQGITAQANDSSHLGNDRPQGPVDTLVRDAAPSEEEGDPSHRTYDKTVSEPHILAVAPGALTLDGAVVLKVLGVDMRIDSVEYDGTLSTGFSSARSTFREDTYRWVVMSFDEGTAEIATDGLLEMAIREPSVSWSGPAAFRSLRGEMRTPGESYAPQDDGAIIQGDFSARLIPEILLGKAITRLALQGDLASTTLQPQAAMVTPARGAPGSLTWPSLLLFGAVVVGGSAGVAVLVTRRRRAVALVAAAPEIEGLVGPYDGLHADDFMRLADEAAVERRWARALQWTRRAREMAPGNARIRADEGEYLFQLGLFEEALHAFAEASRLDGEEGYADYRGAQAAVAAGRPVDEVLVWLQRALARSPDLVGDLELFKEFETMRGLSGYDAMVRDAYARLGIDPAPF